MFSKKLFLFLPIIASKIIATGLHTESPRSRTSEGSLQSMHFDPIDQSSKLEELNKTIQQLTDETKLEIKLERENTQGTEGTIKTLVQAQSELQLLEKIKSTVDTDEIPTTGLGCCKRRDPNSPTKAKSDAAASSKAADASPV